MLRQIRITFRSALAFGLLGVISLLFGIFSVFQVSTLFHSTSELGNHRLPIVTLTGSLRADFLSIRTVGLSLAVAENSEEEQAITQNIRELESSYQQKFDSLSKISRDPTAHLVLDKIAQTKRDYDSALKNFSAQLLNRNLSEAKAIRSGKLNPIGSQMLKLLSEFVDIQNTLTQGTIAQAEQINQSARLSIGVAIALTLIATFVLAWFFSRSITLPLRYALEHARYIAQGDLHHTIYDNAQDEAADMVRALANMQIELKNTVGAIADASQQLATTSEELNAVTNDSSKIVHEQSNQLEMAATAVTELTTAIDEVANSANTTSSASDEVNQKAQLGQGKLESALHEIGKLVQEIDKTTAGIQTLAGNVGDISSVIDVIRGIAEQTNLLALNAAIEAARAGEQGRGFAVVADEVRALAGRTQSSTKEIERMIGGVQEETDKAVTQMENSNQWAKRTMAETSELSGALAEVARLISQINEQNLNVASAAEEQAMVAREVDKSLISIRDLSFQTSAGANQTNASSQELARLAERLNDLVKKFKL